MKPTGGTYRPDRPNIGKLRDVAAQPADAASQPVDAASQPVDAASYRTAKVMTASPLELILMMYEQLFELIPDIKNSIDKGSAAAAEPDAERAQAIVDELINSLDFSIELSKDIGAIYVYVRNLILEANIKFDADIWDQIESVMRPLYEAFKEAERLVGSDGRQFAAQTSAPSIFAGMTYGQGSLKEVVVNMRSGLQA